MLFLLLSVITPLIISSCSIFGSGYDIDIDKEINLLTNDCSCRLLSLHINSDYELLIPFYILVKYIRFDNDYRFTEYCRLADSLISTSTVPIIRLKDMSFIESNKCIFDVFTMKLFESGEYFIINNKTHEFIKSIRFIHRSWYGGTLAAQLNISLMIGDFEFWGEHLSA
jgi:hypothetical protein